MLNCSGAAAPEKKDAIAKTAGVRKPQSGRSPLQRAAAVTGHTAECAGTKSSESRRLQMLCIQHSSDGGAARTAETGEVGGGDGVASGTDDLAHREVQA